MRKRFEQQHELGLKPISETRILTKSRDNFPALVASLVMIFTNESYNEQLFSILENKITKNKKATGRKGMDLWQIFVLAQTRLALNIDYDRLDVMANSNSILRQLLGIERESTFEYKEISLQTIKDNVALLDDETLKQINVEIVKFAHDVFKKKEEEALSLKTDSFVVETNVHFPTDYNLLLDSARKSVDMIDAYVSKNKDIKGWRKSKDWRASLKNLSRALGKASSTRGKYREKNIRISANRYINKAKTLLLKLESSIKIFDIKDDKDLKILIELEYFIMMLDKHIDLVERRLIKGETIPHEEKLFSIFETYTEWISKGKINKKVELGKRLSITSDQFGIILDYHIHENITDSEIVIDIADRILSRYKVDTWSFDKGYWHKDNKELLKDEVRKLIMPKKGKPNKLEKAEEHEAEFVKFRKKHSAVESNINELEHRGLDRCPDRGHDAFKRYVGIGIGSYNLHRVGKELLRQQRIEQKRVAEELIAQQKSKDQIAA